MTHITLPRAVVEQALEAMRFALHVGFDESSESQIKKADKASRQHWSAIRAIEAALAQQAEAVEPVAWSGYDLDGMVEAFSRVIEAHYQRANPFQNPIDMDAQMALRILRGFIPAMKAYTAPPQRKPLSEEEIIDAVRDADLDWAKGWTLDEMQGNRFATLARAIERAHGIGEGA